MTLRPTQDWIWVDLDAGEATGERVTESGVIINADTKTANGTVKGTVKAVGPGKYSPEGVQIPMQVREGDRVVFTKSIALQNKIMHDDVEYILVRDENIIAVID